MLRVMVVQEGYQRINIIKRPQRSNPQLVSQLIYLLVGDHATAW